MEKVKGYKVFNPDWTCRNKKYTCPGVFEEDVIPSVCNRGMHFCKKAADCFNYYSFTPKNKVAEVIAYGAVAENGDKCCTNKLEIIREIPWGELLEIVNSGKYCTGYGNSGDKNSGNWNSGYWNSGDENSGNWNSGDENSGNWNSGNKNSGDWNKCNFSSGCFNTAKQKIYMFNKQSDWTGSDWRKSRARVILNTMPIADIIFVHFDLMTGEEKAAHPEAETTGGYLKKYVVTPDDRQVWWDSLPDCDKKTILSLPNFDAAIFKEIAGIDVGKEM